MKPRLDQSRGVLYENQHELFFMEDYMLAEETRPVVQEAEVSFYVYFISPEDFRLEEFLELVNERYPLTIAHKSKSGVTTVTMRLRPSHLRLLVAILPKHVGISYEPV